MATLTEIRERVRDHLRDTTSVYEEGDLDREIKAAYEFLLNKVVISDTGYFLTSTEIVTDGSGEYDLPAGCIQVKSVADETGETPLDYNSINYEDRSKFLGTYPDTANRSRVFYLIGQYQVVAGVAAYTKIGLIPDTGTITVRYYAYPTALSADADVPALPPTCHELLSLRAAIQIKIAGEEDPSGLISLYQVLYPDLMRFAHVRQVESPRRIKDLW